MPPSICGSVLKDKRSLVAFTWTITTVLTFGALITATIMIIHIHTHYRHIQSSSYNYNNSNRRLSRQIQQHPQLQRPPPLLSMPAANSRRNQPEGYYVQHQQSRYYLQHRWLEGGGGGGQGEGGDKNNNNNNNNHDQNGSNDRQGSNDHGGQQNQQQQQVDYGEYLATATMTSRSMTFVALYTTLMAVALCSYGSTAIVGFTSLRGVYIAPCFSSSGTWSQLKLGIFGGAIIFFANLLIVCAVVFGEVRVEDWANQGGDNSDEKEVYEVERIAAILAITCMFLAGLYTVFAVLLFLYFGSEDAAGADLDDDATGIMGVHHHLQHHSLHHMQQQHHHHHHRGKVSNTPDGLPSIANDPRRENFITMGHAD